MICDLRTEGDSAICDDCVPHLREGRDVMFAEPEKLTARRTGTSYSWASCKASGPAGAMEALVLLRQSLFAGSRVVRFGAGKSVGDGRTSVARLRRERGCGGVVARESGGEPPHSKKGGAAFAGGLVGGGAIICNIENCDWTVAGFADKFEYGQYTRNT